MKQIAITILTVFLLQILLFLLLPLILVKGKYSGKANAIVINSEMKDFPKNRQMVLKLALGKKYNKIYFLGSSGQLPVEDESANKEELPSFTIEKIPLKEKQLVVQAKTILKVLIKQNAKSVIVISEKFDSRRTFQTYNQLLAPLGIDVYTLWLPEKWDDLVWMNDENGIMNVTGNFFKLVLYFIKGYI